MEVLDVEVVLIGPPISVRAKASERIVRLLDSNGESASVKGFLLSSPVALCKGPD
jgi:hypothetical protein